MNKLIIFVFWIFAFCHVGLGAPSISSVQGTFSGDADDTNANLITIDGSGLSNMGKPLVWATMETSTVATTLGQQGFDANQNYVSTDTNQMSHSAGSAVGVWSVAADARSFNFHVNYSTYLAIFKFQKRFRTAALTINEKFDRDFPELDGSGVNNWVASSSNGGVALNECCTGNFDSIDLASQTWVQEEMFWTNGATGCEPTTSDGIWLFLEEGTTEQYTTDNCNGDVAGIQNAQPCHEFTDSAHLQPDGEAIYCDDVYISSHLARVFIANSLDPISASKKEMLIVQTVSDSEVTAYFHQGRFTGGETAYVFACDDETFGNCSSGYQIEIGAAASSTDYGNIPIAVSN